MLSNSIFGGSMKITEINPQRTTVAFGYFEGMHKGHLEVIKKVVERAHKNRTLPILLTFFEEDRMVLTTEEEKAYYARHLGVSRIYSAKATDLDVKEFVSQVLVGKLDVKEVVASEGFVYKGITLKELKEVLDKYEIKLTTIADMKVDGEIISTQKLVKAYDNCDYETYTKLCGHPYMLLGQVVHGKALGRTVGMPTANLGVSNLKKKPIDGVYATITDIEGDRFMGLTNIGKRPSVDNDNRITIETFILDFNKDIYDQSIALEVYFHIRGVQKFSGLEEVQKQVAKDVECSRNKLAQIF